MLHRISICIHASVFCAVEEYADTFMQTMPSFVDGGTFLRKLHQRYDVPPIWKYEKKEVIQVNEENEEVSTYSRLNEA